MYKNAKALVNAALKFVKECVLVLFYEIVDGREGRAGLLSIHLIKVYADNKAIVDPSEKVDLALVLDIGYGSDHYMVLYVHLIVAQIEIDACLFINWL